MVGMRRLELLISRLSDECSNQLNYIPIQNAVLKENSNSEVLISGGYDRT